MKIKESVWDINKKEFYKKVKEKKQEVEDVLTAATEAKGYIDFNTWYSAAYDWGFLRDVLGERAKYGMPWDYNTLVHLPVIVWTDAEETEHRTILSGEVTPDDLGFNITSMAAGDGINVEKTEDDDGHIVFTVSNTHTDLTKVDGYAEDTYLKTINNGTEESPDLGFKWVQSPTVSTQKVSGAPDIYSINLDGDEYNFASGGLSESEVDAKILVETNRATEAEKANTTLINNEVTRAEAAEQEISEALMNEQTERMEADAAVIEKIPSVYLKSITKGTSTVSITDAAGTVTTFSTGGGSSGGVSQEYVDAQDELIKESVTELSQNLSDNYYDKDTVDEKIATGTGLYLGWLQNNAEELPSESDIGTWIDAQEESAWKPSYPTKFTNNDYIFVWFSTQYVYWRCKYVQEEGSTEHSWKKDLEFNDDVVGLTTRVKAVEDKVTTINDTTIPAIQDSVSTLENSKASTQYVTEAVAAEKEERLTSEAELQTGINACEKVANKTTSLTTASTDEEYPTARATFDAIDEVYEDLQSELSNKVDKITTTGYGAYGHSDGAEKDWTVSANADEKTLAYRTTGGVLRVGTPTEDDNATTKSYVDTRAELLTTAPTEAISDGGVHIVYLESEPETKYDGYIYMIKEA